MNTMIARFQTCRWSATRKRIHNLPFCGIATFPRKQYCNAATSVRRLNDAYDRRRIWVITGGRNKPQVQRIK